MFSTIYQPYTLPRGLPVRAYFTLQDFGMNAALKHSTA